MSLPASLTPTQQRALRVLQDRDARTGFGTISSADLEDDVLVACFDLVRLGLAVELPQSDGEVDFQLTDVGIAAPPPPAR